MHFRNGSMHERASRPLRHVARRVPAVFTFRQATAVRAALGGWPITRLKARLNDASES